jgi:hypothetical protein
MGGNLYLVRDNQVLPPRTVYHLPLTNLKKLFMGLQPRTRDLCDAVTTISLASYYKDYNY